MGLICSPQAPNATANLLSFNEVLHYNIYKDTLGTCNAAMLPKYAFQVLLHGQL